MALLEKMMISRGVDQGSISYLAIWAITNAFRLGQKSDKPC